MASFAAELLSGSTDGKGIKITTTSGTGTLIHTAQSGSVDPDMDLLTLYATNQDSQTRTVTLQWGGTTSPDNEISISIPSKSGLYLLCEDMPIRNSLVVRANCDAANVVMIYGGPVKKLA